MKKLTILSIAASSILFASSGLSKKELDSIKTQNKALNSPSVTIVKGQDLGSVYFLKMLQVAEEGKVMPIEGFFDKKTKAIYLGGGYSKEGEKLFLPPNVNIVNNGISFTYGDGPIDLYIVTDPECPFCQKFEKEAKGELKGYTVHVLLFPLPMHQNAKKMIDYINSGSTNEERTKRYHAVVGSGSKEYEKSEYNEKRLNEYLDKVNPAVMELNVRGTPSFYIKEGDTLKSFEWKKILK